MPAGTVAYRDFLREVISPTALSLLERMTPVIYDIYDLDVLLEAEVQQDDQVELQARFIDRLRRIVRLLPPDISPMANEVYTAIEFLLYEIRGEPIVVGLALARLEELSDEIRADPLLHSLVLGRAN